MNPVQHPRTVITVEKPLSEVKNSINSILAIGNSYQLIRFDEFSNIYQLGVVEGVTPVFLSVVLTKISHSKTIIKVEGKAVPTATASKKTLEHSIASLIAIVSKILSGQPVTSEMVRRGHRNNHRHQMVVLIAALTAVVIAFVVSQLA